MKTYEVYPSVERGNTYKRLIAVNGVPLPPAELERRTRIHREDVLREAAKRERETPQERERRLRKEAKERAEWNRTLDEVFEVYDIRLVGRETLDGHATVVATLEPRPAYRPRTEAGKWMKKLRGALWISESDYQVVKAVAQVIDDVTFGWGLRWRLHKGTVAEFERTKSEQRGLAARARRDQGHRPRPAPAVHDQQPHGLLGLQEVQRLDRGRKRGDAAGEPTGCQGSEAGRRSGAPLPSVRGLRPPAASRWQQAVARTPQSPDRPPLAVVPGPR